MATLFDRIAYIIIGPAYDPISHAEIFDTIAGIPDSIVGIPLAPTFNPTGGIMDSNYNYIYGWPYVNFFDPPKKDNIVLYGLKTVFDIKKNFGTSKNDAEIRIYNVKKDTWKKMENREKEFKVYLVVGYKGLNSNDIPASLLYIGDIEKMTYERSGVNWIMTIEAKDGQKIHNDFFVNKSFKPGTDLKNALIDILETAENIERSYVEPATKWIKQYLSKGRGTIYGLIVSGKLVDEINKLLAIYGATLNIENDVFEIIWNDSNITQYSILLSEDSGLLSSPIGKDKGIELKTLLMPHIKPGVLLKIESEIINDYFVVEKVHIRGDTHGSEWSCMIEANKRLNMIKDIPINKTFSPFLMEPSTVLVPTTTYSLITPKTKVL